MYYYKFDITKWLKRTARLMPEMEGIYLRLINHYYDTEKPLPLDKTTLARTLGLSAYREQMDIILLDFFVETPEGYINDKCDNILAEYHQNVAKNRKNGAKGGRPSSPDKPKTTDSDSEINPVGSQSVPSGEAAGEPNGEAKANPDHNPNERQFTKLTEYTEPTTTPETSSVVDPSGKPDGGERKAPTPAVPFKAIQDKWNAMAAEQGWPKSEKLSSAIKGQIRQRHQDLKRDLGRWDNFFQYIAENDFLSGRAPPGPNRSAPFRPRLAWVTKEENFIKIAEGGYA